MIVASSNITNMIDSPVRSIVARVELFEGSTLLHTFNHDDRLIDFSIERVGEENKFFGVGISQHLVCKIFDKDRELDLTTQHKLKVSFGVNGEYIYPFPTFHVTQARRDEKTNDLTIYGYDLVKQAAAATVSQLELTAPYSVLDFMNSCASYLNTELIIEGIGDAETCLETSYPNGANFDGSETLREGLNDAAEVTQTIYFTNSEDKLVFKRLEKNADAKLDITKSKYFKLETKNGKRLSKIQSNTELGNNIFASIDNTGSTQYVRDNAFWELREDLSNLLESAIAAVGGLSIGQFNCSWRGNFLLELGDKITLTTKDNKTVTSYLLDDTIKYDGALSQETQWNYDDEGNSEGNPVTLGERLNETFSKVDKVAGQIDLVAKKSDELGSQVSSIQLNTDSISASVQQIETNTKNAIDSMAESIETLTQKLETTITEDSLQIEVQKAIGNGVTSVTTSTGFTFNEDGLSVTKSNSEMETRVTEDGMKVYKNSTEVLSADNTGVKALNLHATTYLIIGSNSRFEDYDNGTRTGCFWIGS